MTFSALHILAFICNLIFQLILCYSNSKPFLCDHGCSVTMSLTFFLCHFLCLKYQFQHTYNVLILPL